MFIYAKTTILYINPITCMSSDSRCLHVIFAVFCMRHNGPFGCKSLLGAEPSFEIVHQTQIESKSPAQYITD